MAVAPCNPAATGSSSSSSSSGTTAYNLSTNSATPSTNSTTTSSPSTSSQQWCWSCCLPACYNLRYTCGSRQAQGEWAVRGGGRGDVAVCTWQGGALQHPCLPESTVAGAPGLLQRSLGGGRGQGALLPGLWRQVCTGRLSVVSQWQASAVAAVGGSVPPP
jgi:hypothetical protein